MAQSKYKNWPALKMKLSRILKSHQFLSKNYSSLATLILDTFLENDGIISAKKYYGSPFEITGKNYTQWIDELRKIGIVEHVPVANPQKTDWIRYTPGPVTREYINREKIAQKEIATKDEVPSKAEFNVLKDELSHTKMELTDTKNRVTTIEESMKKVYSKLKLGEPDPPGYGKLQQHLTKDETN